MELFGHHASYHGKQIYLRQHPLHHVVGLITLFVTLSFLLFIYSSTARAQTCVRETEPNDQRAEATLLVPLTCVEGESVDTDEDFYRVKVDEEQAKERWDAQLAHEAGETFEFCILDAQGEMAQCRSGSNLVLSDLVFVPGEVDFRVKSRRTGGAYTLTFTANGEVTSSDEAEPNDLVATASPIVNSLSIQGRFVEEEDDIYRFEASGSVARFRAEVEGTGVA